jgi:glycerophosphoryl diester phosphodiesterase
VYLPVVHLLLDPSQRPVIGHRGDRAFAPENTIESLLQAVAKGVDAVEFDLHLSRDGVPVLMHDPTLDRTTSGTGEVREQTVDQLKHHNAGARHTNDDGRTHPWSERGVRIPTLDEALAALPKSLPLIIEMKTVEVAAPALRVLERTQSLGRVLIGSFLQEALIPFIAAGVPVSAAPPTLARLYVPSMLGVAKGPRPFQALCIPRHHHVLPLPVRGYARMMRAAGGATHVWTVNDPVVAQRLWALGVNGIISDDPGAILRARGAAA